MLHGCLKIWYNAVLLNAKWCYVPQNCLLSTLHWLTLTLDFLFHNKRYCLLSNWFGETNGLTVGWTVRQMDWWLDGQTDGYS